MRSSRKEQEKLWTYSVDGEDGFVLTSLALMMWQPLSLCNQQPYTVGFDNGLQLYQRTSHDLKYEIICGQLSCLFPILKHSFISLQINFSLTLLVLYQTTKVHFDV